MASTTCRNVIASHGMRCRREATGSDGMCNICRAALKRGRVRRGSTLAALALSAAVMSPMISTGAAQDANAPGAPVTARPTVDAIAPGGNITSVVNATAARGWPHRPDANERADIRGIVVATFIPRRTPPRVVCAFGPTMGAPIRCRIRTRAADLLVFIGLPATRTATGRTLPAIPGVFEDGSYRISAVLSATEQD